MWNHIKFIKKLKSILPLGFKLILIRVLVFLQRGYYNVFPKEITNHNDKVRKIYLLLSTDYSNLGDHALSYAHKKLIEDHCPDAEIIEILVGDTMKYLKSLKKVIKRGDILTLKGGGNIGLEYFREELYRREIINMFRENKIVIFPQTIYFPDTRIGKKEFENSQKIYSNNSNLYLIVRDKKSYDLFKGALKSRAILTPDIVLYLDDIKKDFARKGALTVMRSDVEGKFTDEQKTKLEKILENYYGSVLVSDTTTDYKIPISQRVIELIKNWNLFLKSEIVVTDRLHGMVFAAITQTPCIVFNTYNHKVLGQYEWIKHLKFIKFLKFNLEEIENCILYFKNTRIDFDNRERYKEDYEKIIQLLRRECV
jgi:pyruvyl transferase EpsI